MDQLPCPLPALPCPGLQQLSCLHRLPCLQPAAWPCRGRGEVRGGTVLGWDSAQGSTASRRPLPRLCHGLCHVPPLQEASLQSHERRAGALDGSRSPSCNGRALPLSRLSQHRCCTFLSYMEQSWGWRADSRTPSSRAGIVPTELQSVVLPCSPFLTLTLFPCELLSS